VVVVEGGVNDCGGYPDLTVPIAAMQLFLANLRAGLPTAKIYVTSAQQIYPAFETAHRAATRAIGGTYVSWVSWFTGTGDSTHLHGDGNKDVYMQSQPHMTTVGYTYAGTCFAFAISPPATGLDY
jgi:hypothetical protein